MKGNPLARPLFWVGSSKSDLVTLPEKVIDVFGYALFLAQTGRKHSQARPLKGYGSAVVLEIVEDWQGNAFRTVYTVRFVQGVFVLHVFQKKSRRGIATAKQDLELIRQRLKAAEELAKELKP
jgi:phage-related protein